MTTEDDRPLLGRRQVLAGAGALAAGTGAGTGRAEARVSPIEGGRERQASPVVSTIASPQMTGYSYRHFFGYDFTPDFWNSGRTSGVGGIYSNNGSANMWVACDVPPGALVREIEWYVLNDTSGAVRALGRLWTAGTRGLLTVVADIFIPPAGPVLQAAKAVTTSATWGPYPTGTKLALGMSTTGDKTQVQGVRVGFSNGAAQAGIRTIPIKAYDTLETGGKFAAGETRVISLSTVFVPAGSTAVLLRITATAATANGVLDIDPANQTDFDLSAMTYIRALKSVGEATVAITPTRQLKVKATQPVHVRLDVVGTFA